MANISSYSTVDTSDSVAPEHVAKTNLNLQRVLCAGLGVLLMFGILAFGAVQEWSTFAFETGAAILFLIWAGKQIVSRQVGLSKNTLYLPSLLFFGLLLAQLALRTSAYPYVTKYELLQYASYGIVLLITAECVVKEEARKIFALALIIFGAAYAFYALAQQLTSQGKFFWLFTPRFSGAIYGSYVNHNHYAGLMEMLVPFPLVVSMGHLLKREQRALVAFCSVLMASTIFLSGSRGGMLSFTVEIVVFAALTLIQKGNIRVAAGMATVFALVLSFLFFVGKGRVLGRLGDLDPSIRSDITKDCLRMFLHRPVLGWGLGTFPTVYPSFRSFYTNLFVNEAHNDYAQLLVETGLVGFVLMLWFISCVYRSGLPRSSRRWEFNWDGAVSLAALLGCTGLLAHSFVDFNLQIPANAAIFYSLCGLAATPLPKSFRKRASRETKDAESGNGTVPNYNGRSFANSS